MNVHAPLKNKVGHEMNHKAKFVTNFAVCGSETKLGDRSTVMDFHTLLRPFMGFMPIPGPSRKQELKGTLNSFKLLLSAPASL